MKSFPIVTFFLLLIMPGCIKSPDSTVQEQKAERYASVIRVKPEKLEEYKALHADPWPGVDSMIKICNIRNYSIYYRDGLLFSYFEYTGTDFEEDMSRMAEDSLTQAWWKLTDPCQIPVESAPEGVWWAPMEEVYHLKE
jgi:L-rhamnose mutarotase